MKNLYHKCRFLLREFSSKINEYLVAYWLFILKRRKTLKGFLLRQRRGRKRKKKETDVWIHRIQNMSMFNFYVFLMITLAWTGIKIG